MITTGPHNLITDVAGILVGHARDDRIKTGVSVVTSDRPFCASYAVMGGAPGTRDTDLLEPDKTVSEVDAIVLSGGSAFGLDAASGVSARLQQAGRGFSVGQMNVPIVPTAILFDLANGGQKDWPDGTYQCLGKQAYDAISNTFSLGSVGVGTGAMCGMIKGGLGSASLRLPTDGYVGALMGANPIGNVVDQTGRFWAHNFEIDAEYGNMGPVTDGHAAFDMSRTKIATLASQQNTTIGVVATDLCLTKAQLKRLATAAHDGIARSIVPSHLPFDGDLIFTVSTGILAPPRNDVEFATLCHYASICVARSIARGIFNATPYENDAKPAWIKAFG